MLSGRSALNAVCTGASSAHFTPGSARTVQPVGGAAAVAAAGRFDQVLYDLMGKALGVPAYRLTGGACRDRVRVYANGWYTGDREPAAFAELSRAELRRSIDIVAAVRAAVGPETELYVEGHARFAMHTAARLVRELEPFDLGWFEEPLPWTHIERYAELRARATMPISGGEHFHNRYEYARLFATDAVDIIQPDLSMAGGFTEVRKLAAIADQMPRLRFMPPYRSSL
ncbi:Enolase C-terminal domain-like [Micromonospora haikouensis]|uniref:Enolase C-terminal domain-like n=1 Tax=Micromonospora haikouensis TaxID=686309 RepID=A0A1C4W3B0_9ACTN|nr:enolase C-terminal domain-like protein [Micromonospora haikouensis]SCE90726.1 Enolase C-terminal domain-like [Micromonospora haikouensis]